MFGAQRRDVVEQYHVESAKTRSKDQRVAEARGVANHGSSLRDRSVLGDLPVEENLHQLGTR